MLSYWIRKDGGGTVLERRETERPVPENGMMLVRMTAASMNRGDLLGRSRRHCSDTARPAGLDGCGTVVEPGNSTFRVGERVMFRGPGLFAEFASVDPALAHRVPERLTDVQAAVIPGVYITAFEALVQFGRVTAGDWVLLCGASSGVGVAALQIARLSGARVIATTGSAHKVDALAALGAEAVVQARGGAFADEVMRLTGGRGVDVSLNMVGGTAFPACVQVSAHFGRVVFVGYVDGQLQAECDLSALHARRMMICGTSNAPLSPLQRAEASRAFERAVMPALASGQIVPVIDRVYSFDRISEAKDYVETDQHLGKVVVSIP